MSERSIEADPETFEVMRADRRFPMLPDARHSPPCNHIRELQVDRPTKRCRIDCRKRFRSVWRGMRLRSLRILDRETVVGAYVNSLKRLAEFQSDIENLVYEVCRANLEFRQAAVKLTRKPVP